MQNKTAATASVRLRAPQGQRTVNLAGRERKSRSWSRTLSATEETIASISTKDTLENVNVKQHYAGKKALIVGAGPAGSVASSFLAKQGFQVDIYEQRKDPTKTVVAPTRSISVALNSATVNALKAANINTPGSEEGFMNGMHSFLGASFLTPNGDLMPPISDFKGWLLVERMDFATNVMDVVRSEHPERITSHFEHSCIAVDLTKQEVEFQDRNKNILKRNYDLLIGADGVTSQVRKAMEEHSDSFKVSTTLNTRFYVSCPNIVVNKDRVPEKYKRMVQPGVSTFYVNVPKFGSIERGLNMNFSRLASGNLSVNIDSSQFGLESAKSNAKEYLNEVLPDDFPQDWIDQMTSQLEASPLYRLPSIMEVSTLVGPHVVLIGDAGHAVSPGLGFGCNLAIQDGLALNEALEYAKGDINLALKVFNDNRYKVVREVQWLEKVFSAKSFKHEGINKLLPLFADFHLLFHALGNRYFPWFIPKTAISRCLVEEISSGEAARSLQVEVATLIALAASVMCLTFAIVIRVS